MLSCMISQSHTNFNSFLVHDKRSIYFFRFTFFFLEDFDRTLGEYDYGSMSEAYVSLSKTRIEHGTQSLRIK